MQHLYPWLEEFKLDFYSLDFYPGHTEEFYVNLGCSYSGHRSLYVPYKAFFSYDEAAIIKRNADYLRWYTKGDDVWLAMRENEIVINFFRSLKAYAPVSG